MQALVILPFQNIQFILGGKCFYRIRPKNVLVISAGHQSGIICFAGNVDQCLIRLVYFSVVFLFLILTDQAVDIGISLRIHAESIIIIGLSIEQIIIERVIFGCFSSFFQLGQLLFGSGRVLKVDVHLQALLIDTEAQIRHSLATFLFASCNQ